jgi:Protein of unknown function (DUF1552)
MNSLKRRQFLRGAGSLIALPALQSFGFKAFASTKAPAPPKRIVFLGFGFGVTNETWFPDTNKVGAEWTLSEGLQPLARHQKDLTVVQGCSNKFANEAHWGSTFWLTGANRYSEPGQSFHNSISADQVAAEFLGKDTRYSSIQLNTPDANNSGHGPGLSLAWDKRGKPMAGLENPVTAFHRLFSDDTIPLSERQALLARKRSVLDAVLEDSKRVRHGLAKEDVDKLDEYYQSIRDIEVRIGKDEQWLNVPKAKVNMAPPKPGLAGKEEIQVMYDLIATALQTDSSRVITYRQPVNTLLRSLDIKVGSHDMSHYSAGERMIASQKRDLAQSELLAGLIDKLKAVREADGSSLFDNTCLAYGSNIRSIHYLDNCPTLLTGGAANLKLGQHIVLPKDTPLCNVWLTMLHGIGLNPNELVRHGDSTGVVKELQA